MATFHEGLSTAWPPKFCWNIYISWKVLEPTRERQSSVAPAQDFISANPTLKPKSNIIVAN